MSDTQPAPPRVPRAIQRSLQSKLRKMNDYGPKRTSTPEKLAYEIQHLQQELAASKRYWIRRVV